MAEIRNFQFTQEEIDKGKGMSVLAYLGILVFIPMLAAKDNRYVMFHTEQGLALFILSIVTFFVFVVLDTFLLNFIDVYICGGSILYLLARLFIIVLVVIGIINAVQGNARKLPVIGDFGEKFNLVK